MLKIYKHLLIFFTIALIVTDIYASDHLFVQNIQASVSSLESATPNSYITGLLFAYIGGFILNFMPCVLPVLALKVYALIKHPPHYYRKICLSVIAGITFSFTILSMLAIMLKSSGNFIGFGVNFQNHQFIIALCIVITFFISSATDKIQISVPQIIHDKLLKINFNNVYTSGFFSGILATILSIPCNAPFLGSAIALAITASNQFILLSFIFVGLGFSTPYFLIIINPNILSFLPKPGKWMVKFKMFLALLLFTTLFWLLFILYAQIGLRPTLIVAGLLLLIKYIIET